MHWKVGLVALLLLAQAPATMAQDAPTLGEYFRLGEDTAGDHAMDYGGVHQEESPFDPADLLALDIRETSDSIWFRLSVSGLEHQDSVWTANGNEFLDYTYYYYELWFDAMGRTFEVNLNYYVDGEEDRDVYAYVYTYYQEGNAYYGSYLSDVEAMVDESNNALLINIPRDLLANSNGEAPGFGDSLTNFYVNGDGSSTIEQFTFGLARSQDRLPDTGFLPISWEILEGVVSAGHISAISDRPVRVSNGEATTFLYEVDVTNNGNFVDYVLPSWEGGREDWIVTFPDSKIRIDPGESKTLPFLVSVPFSHQHGTYHPFLVTLQSQADPLAAGKLELGVRYTAVPQPAGHHPTVYMHDYGGDLFFNTIEGDDVPDGASEQEASDLENADSYTCGNPGASYGEATLVPLSPRLEMGVDFDLDAVGEATLITTSTQKVEGVWFDGFITVTTDRPSPCDATFGRTPEGVVAQLEPSEPKDVTANSLTAHELVITPLTSGDYIPYEDGLQMWFFLIMHRDGIAPNDALCCLADDFEATLVADGTEMFLPLLDYHDDVDEFFNRLTGIDLYATTPQERLVNPGETVLFRITAQNIGAVESEFTLALTGTNTQWATLLGDATKLKLKPGQSQDLVVAVQPPAGAHDGDLADVTLLMTHREDDSVRSIIRFLAEVDTGADHPDEALEATTLDEELQQAPAIGPMASLALLGAAAWASRRRN